MSFFTSTRVKVYALLMACNLIVFALAAHVNTFHSFFYVADQAPFILSIFTFLIVGSTLLGDMKGSNPFMSRPRIELAWLALLTFFWLCFNAFSSSRWRFIQATDCGDIPGGSEFSSVAVWCKEVQALRSFVWIEWLILAGTLVWLTIVVTRAARRNNRIWSTSLARESFQPTPPDVRYIKRPSAAFSTNSSFYSNEPAGTAATPQTLGPDFENQSQEHWQNINRTREHPDIAQHYAAEQQYGYPHNYSLPQQQENQQHLQQEQYTQQQPQHGQYYFGGYGHAQ